MLPRLIETAAKERLPALAITDHGNMFGAIEFYVEAKKQGVMPIIGCEVYIAPGSRFEKSTHGVHEASFHLVLLAKDEEGYQNLMKLVTIANLEGFYYRPRIDKEVLSSHSKGLLGLSACLHGEIPNLILAGQIEKAVEVAGNLKEIFGPGNFYLELMDNMIAEQAKVNKALLEISQRLSIPVVATNDVHYLGKKEAYAHDVLLCIQTQTTLDDPNRLRFQTEEFYFKSPQEMKELFREVPQAIRETLKIVEKCSLELSFDRPLLPHFKPPEGKNREAFLRELCEEGLKRRYTQVTAILKERMEYELGIISKTGYTSYFLIAWDA
ncbi:MAG: PHP domain-containing protein, partial [Nitrospirota bacterium]